MNITGNKSKGRRVCSWCGLDMGPAATEGDTHGVCQRCAEGILNDLPQEPEKVRTPHAKCGGLLNPVRRQLPAACHTSASGETGEHGCNPMPSAVCVGASLEVFTFNSESETCPAWRKSRYPRLRRNAADSFGTAQARPAVDTLGLGPVGQSACGGPCCASLVKAQNTRIDTRKRVQFPSKPATLPAPALAFEKRIRFATENAIEARVSAETEGKTLHSRRAITFGTVRSGQLR